MSQSPAGLFIITAATIFIAEVAVMVMLSGLPPLPIWSQALIDSFLLIILLVPLLYFSLLRPMRRYVTELFAANNLLKSEMLERRQAETALRESEKQLRCLSAQLLTAQETERRRISKELHEELAQTLSAVKMGLRSV